MGKNSWAQWKDGMTPKREKEEDKQPVGFYSLYSKNQQLLIEV